MQKLIEEAKSGRARCRGCRKNIDKGELRYGEEAPNQFGDGTAMQWLHLMCAAKKHPREMKEAMAAFTGEIANRAEVEAAIGEALSQLKSFPYAEFASTGRSRCLACRNPIDKDSLRIAVEREVEMGGIARAGAGYLHLQCAKEFVNDPTLGEKLKQNSSALKPDELAVVLERIA